MPSLTLGMFYMAQFTRYVRSTLTEVLQEPYVDTARAKGVSERKVILRHAGRNAMIPVITLLGLRLPFMFGGAVLAETVFAWPGMGRLMVTSVYERDSATLIGITLMLGMLVVLSNLLVDLVYVLVDPRIRYTN
jgi:peptide/nickel transport system permease protein